MIPASLFARSGSVRIRWRITRYMVRPCFLVIDKQVAGLISTRKLVIETAMLNVLTAYSSEEGIEMLKRFPAVDGIVLDTEVDGPPCKEIVAALRNVRADLPVITVSPSGLVRCGNEDYHVSSYDPHDLLEQINKICSKETLRAAQQAGQSGDI